VSDPPPAETLSAAPQLASLAVQWLGQSAGAAGVLGALWCGLAAQATRSRATSGLTNLERAMDDLPVITIRRIS
jgi:hypothetical protein